MMGVVSIDRIQLWSGIASGLVLLILVVLVRKSRLKASYSLLWFAGWALCTLFIVFPKWLDKISSILGIAYSPTLLVLMMVMSLGLIILHFTIVIRIGSVETQGLISSSERPE